MIVIIEFEFYGNTRIDTKKR